MRYIGTAHIWYLSLALPNYAELSCPRVYVAYANEHKQKKTGNMMKAKTSKIR